MSVAKGNFGVISQEVPHYIGFAPDKKKITSRTFKIRGIGIFYVPERERQRERARARARMRKRMRKRKRKEKER